MNDFVADLTSVRWWVSVVVVGVGINFLTDFLKLLKARFSSALLNWFVRPATSRFQKYLSRLSTRLAARIAAEKKEASDRTMALSISKSEQFFEIARAMRWQQRGILYQIEASLFIAGAVWAKYRWQDSNSGFWLFIACALAACVTLMSAFKEFVRANARWREVERAHTLIPRVVDHLVNQVLAEEAEKAKAEEIYDLQ